MEYQKTIDYWRGKGITTGTALSEALHSFAAEFAYHSGKIENESVDYTDVREIFDRDGVTSYTGDLRTLFEIRNARDANERMLTAFDRKEPVTEELIKSFQKLLTQNTYDARRWALGERPGEYKKHDWVTGINEIGASPEDVQEEMRELLDEIRQVPKGKELIAAAYFHAKFENIHPFADGNGRTGRLAMNCFLLLHDHPPVIVFEEDRKQYYSALEAWDERQELAPLVSFFQKQTEKTWAKQVEKQKKREIGQER